MSDETKKRVIQILKKIIVEGTEEERKRAIVWMVKYLVGGK